MAVPPVTDTCPICLDPLIAPAGLPQTALKVTRCAHRFHAACIDPWYIDQGTCPTCRGNLLGVGGMVNLNLDAAADDRDTLTPLARLRSLIQACVEWIFDMLCCCEDMDPVRSGCIGRVQQLFQETA